MASSSSGPTLTCSQCSFANEAERVYCHNCGAKLDRSLLPKAEEAVQESSEKARRRVQKMTNPGGMNVMREVKAFANCVMWGALVAFIVGIVREPDGLPPAKSEDLTLRMIGTEMLEAAELPQPRALQFTDAEANSYLRTALKTKGAGWMPGASFVRAFVKFDPGNVYFGLEQSLFGLPLHSGVRTAISVKDGKFFAESQGGNIGRVSIHPLLMKYAGAVFQPVWKSLKRENDQVQAMQQILIGKGGIRLVTKGRGK